MTAIDPVSSRTTSAPAQSASATGALSLSDNYDTFLNLLTAQLRNQDPLNPTDPTEFVSQLTQFSQLEQSVAQTGYLEDLAALQMNASSLSGLNFLGREVEAYSDSISLEGGASEFGYEVTAPGETMAVHIYNEEDKLIAALDAETAVGRHAIAWDGVTDTGADAPAGLYRAELVAINGEDVRKAGEIIITDRVQELRFGGAGAELALQSGITVSSVAVFSVRDAEPVGGV